MASGQSGTVKKSADGLRLTIGVVNLAVWLPWLIAATFYLSQLLPLIDPTEDCPCAYVRMVLLLAAPVAGLVLGTICLRGKFGWEIRALWPLILLVCWSAYLYFEISSRSLNAASGCAICSHVDVAISAAAILMAHGAYRMMFGLLWYELIAPASVLLSVVLLSARNSSSLWRSGKIGKANAT